jgi:hypothetical protein
VSGIKHSVIEISEKKDFAGRRYIKLVLHKIHQNSAEYNENGITWLEKYVLKNIESAQGIPICAEFLDEWEKDEPYGHGMTDIKDNQPIFENSVVVGVIQNAFIEHVEVNGENIKALVGEGYLYEQRYPQFIKWLKSELFDNKPIYSSVEICAKKDNADGVIVYEGGWREKGRIPMEYDYSGHAILSIPPADNNAILLELNSKYKEDQEMKDTVVELNNKIDEQRNEINSLKEEVKQKDLTIDKLNQKVEEKQTELNSTIDELKGLKSKIEEKDKEITKLKELEVELNELRSFKKKIEDKDLISQLNQKLTNYTDEEKEVVKEKIELFNKEPKKELMSEIINEINSAIAKRIVEERSKRQKTEVNSLEDIYEDVIEINSVDKTPSIEELY